MRRRRALAVAAAAAFAAPSVQAQVTYAQGTKERQVRFATSDGVILSGTLLLPMISEIQYVPGVVLVAGSGPTDRDGNNTLAPARIDLLKQIAELLAGVGIATLRYDKRGIGASSGPPSNSLEEQERFYTWENFVSDVQVAHAELRRHDEISPNATAFLGHSEGALLSLAATQAMSQFAPYALVLAGAPGRPLRDIVRGQIGRNAPILLAEAERVMAAIVNTGHVPAETLPELRLIFPPYVGPFLRSALTFDSAKVAAGIATPCLMLHGAADIQICLLYTSPSPRD